MDPIVLSGAASAPQGPPWRRLRRCLLKGCERWFRPVRPQCRYCSDACRRAAQRWRRWRAQQKYRASGNGRQHRQQQARRYRQQRQRARPPAARPPPVAAAACAAARHGGSATPCEGKRLHEKGDHAWLCPCDRPGCYVLLTGAGPYQARRFCCALCRQALRAVLQREARWRRRRRRGLQRPGRRPRRQTRGP